MKYLLPLLGLVALFMAGCLQPPVKVGCCIKENATNHDGCLLYNESSDTILNLFAKTNPESDGQKCNVTGNYCNVTFDPGRDPYLVPICTEDDILTCRSPDCLAMVCGDFKFKPVIAPGLTGEGEDAKADVPADTQDQAAVQFYKAQCRFLPMDGNLKKILKNSKSAINVFRVGVGGSFDEYEQYRYFFPESDKFCAVNPPREGELRVDRYMNYLDPSTLDQYDPITGITNNCIDESGGAQPPEPFRYDESGIGTRSGTMTQGGYSVPYSYTIALKDSNNYKFANWGRLDYNDVAIYGSYYYLYNPSFSTFSMNKKIDVAFYKKWLSIAHADTMYGLSASVTNTTRAPFECDSSATECYSGICSIDNYNRAVMLSVPDANNDTAEIVTDCESYTDEFRNTKIVCAPTTKVTITGSTTAPQRDYAKVDARTVHLDGPQVSAPATCGIADSDHLTMFFDWLYAGGGYHYGDPWGDASCSGALSNAYAASPVTATDIGNITDSASTYMYWYNSTSGTWNSTFSQLSQGPPAGGALFFGDVDPEARYQGNKVIGYALATPQQVKDLLVVKNCQMVENVDYKIVQVPNNPSDWGELKDTFGGYFKERFSGMSAITTGDDCGAQACKLYDDAPTLACSYFYDFFWTSLPWVINVDKQPGPSSAYFTPGSSSFILASEIGIAEKKINRFSESYASTSDGTSCTLRGMNNGYYLSTSRESDDTNYYIWVEGRQPSYDLLYSKYIVLFFDKGDQAIGRCAIDEATGAPKIRTYGWCEPCTTSTLAYQSVSTTEDNYFPGGIADLESGGSVDLSAAQSQICVGRSDGLECANNLITDANDYSVSDGDIPAAPRTYPEASVMKERLGNYMKSGVMPVLDMSDESNWNQTSGSTDDSYASGSQLDEYDFQRLIGNMGAAVIIVDRVHNESEAASKANDIADRSSAIRSRCFGCLTAFQVVGADTNDSFWNITDTVFATNYGNKFTIDMVTFDYAVSDHTSGLPAKGAAILAIDPTANLTLNYSKIIADDIANYAQGVLKKQGKPTMLVGLNLDSGDTVFTQDRYSALFDTIVMSQEEMIKSGLVGIIYSPARQPYIFGFSGPPVGLVDVSGGVGTKNPKFCAFQGAMQKMTAAPPVAIYSLASAVNNTYCQPCTSLEKSQGACGSGALQCDNGLDCTPPPGFSLSDIEGAYRCPENTVIDDEAGGQRCTLCADVPGTYTCTFSYSNGTIDTRSGNMTDLTSDSYLDIIAGIPKPQKCCLEDAAGGRYSYFKKTSNSQINKPIAFSKTGDPNADCGLGVDVNSIKEAQSFCNIQIPVKDYDVSCTLSG
jgi:hypothetical protein